MDKEVVLPKVIFLAGSDASAKRRFAHELADLRSDVMVLGFAEPLRGAVLGTFFQCDPLLDLQKPKLMLPGIDAQNSETFQENYRHFLKSTYGKGVLGRIMAPRIVDNEDFYDTYVFEDADDADDIEAIISIVGKDNCLVLEIQKESTVKDFLTRPTPNRS